MVNRGIQASSPQGILVQSSIPDCWRPFKKACHDVPRIVWSLYADDNSKWGGALGCGRFRNFGTCILKKYAKVVVKAAKKCHAQPEKVCP